MTTNTSAQTKTRILDILELVSNIKRAKTGSARALGSTLPAAFVLTGPAQYSEEAEDTLLMVRDYRIVILAAGVEAGREGDSEETLEPLYDAIRVAMFARPSLNTSDNTDPLPSVRKAYLTDDSGFVVTEVAGVNYASCEFILRVEHIYDLPNRGL